MKVDAYGSSASERYGRNKVHEVVAAEGGCRR